MVIKKKFIRSSPKSNQAHLFATKNGPNRNSLKYSVLYDRDLKNYLEKDTICFSAKKLSHSLIFFPVMKFFFSHILRFVHCYSSYFQKKLFKSKLYSDENDATRLRFFIRIYSYLFAFKRISCSTGYTHLNALMHLLEITPNK